MRYLAFILFAVLMLFSCTSDHPEHQLWVRQGDEVTYDDGNTYRSGGGRLLLNYREDSLFFRQFFYDLAVPAYDYRIPPLALHKSLGKTLAGPLQDSIFFEARFRQDQIEMVATHDSLYRYSFEPLPRFKQAKHEQLMQRHLLNNTIILRSNAFPRDSFRIEFLPNRRVISGRIWLGEYAFWSLESYEEELFLVFDGFLGSAFHIEEVTDSMIKSTTYGMNSGSSTWSTTPIKIRFDQSLLLGRWREDMGEDHKEMYTSIVNPDYNTYEPKILAIDSNMILELRPSRVDTNYWMGNREGDLMRLSASGNYWTIIKLIEEELVFS